MRPTNWPNLRVRAAIRGTVLLALVWQGGAVTPAQDRGAAGAPRSQAPELSALTDIIGKLQAQVQDLTAALKEVRADQAGERSEIGELRRELAESNAKLASLSLTAPGSAKPSVESSSAAPVESSVIALAGQGAPAYSSDAVSSLQEDLQLANSKITEQSQTKVESGSKYRLRFSGIVLLNLFSSRGLVDNLDFPQFVSPPESPAFDSPNAFGGTLRQSQIRVQAFGPDVAGAHTSADLKFDFAGGFEGAPNGALLGIARLRTGTIRFDWTDTSIVAGQDFLFFAPLVPTSLSSLAIPALSYSGNLWGWTPQVRVEHRVALSESSKLLLQGGILDSLSGDIPQSQYERNPTWGEESGQPAYAGRIAWSHAMGGQEFTVGGGGYYGRQSWGFGRNVDGWVVTTDLLLPLGRQFEVSGEFYRGKAVGGLGGGIGQTSLWQGSFGDPATVIHGLDSEGGWLQLKFKPTGKFQINGALGIDNPFAGELRKFGGNPYYETFFFSRNLTPFVNFIYQPRSDVVFSTEFRRLKTTILDGAPQAANQVNFSVGYLF
jgi:hypothetical protein